MSCASSHAIHQNPAITGRSVEMLKHFHMPEPFYWEKEQDHETHGRENIQQSVHSPWHWHSSNKGFSGFSPPMWSPIRHVFPAAFSRSWNARWRLWFPCEITHLVCFLRINGPYGTSPRLGSDQTEQELQTSVDQPVRPMYRPLFYKLSSVWFLRSFPIGFINGDSSELFV